MSKRLDQLEVAAKIAKTVAEAWEIYQDNRESKRKERQEKEKLESQIKDLEEENRKLKEELKHRK